MSFEDQEQISLKNTLILADPSLLDPNFRKAVLLLTEHSAEMGAHGFILNRPLGKTVGHFLDAEEFSGLADIPVFLGGPVNAEQLTFASFQWEETRGALDYSTHLSRSEALERSLEGFEVRAFIGYAGWTSGQLEAELQQRAWIAQKPVPAAAHLAKVERLWETIMESMGPWHELMSRAPDNPSLN